VDERPAMAGKKRNVTHVFVSGNNPDSYRRCQECQNMKDLIHRGVSSFYGFIKNPDSKILVSRNRHYRPNKYIAEKRKNGLKVTPTHIITLATASSR
jgi:hypothetical protein